MLSEAVPLMLKIVRLLAFVLVASGCHAQSGLSKCEMLRSKVASLSAHLASYLIFYNDREVIHKILNETASLNFPVKKN